MANYILTELFKKWGPNKTAQLTALFVIGGGLFLIIGANLIPDEPITIIEKEI